MKYAYLIMAHNDLFCLNHLLQALDDGDNAIFLHLDKKWDINTKKIYSTQNADLHVYQKLDVRWGSFSQIQCELFLFEQAANVGFDYYHLLSGADLPLKSQSYIKKFFRYNAGKEFLFFQWYDASKEDKNIIDRVNIYYFFPFKQRRKNYLLNLVLSRVQKNIVKRRKNLVIYKGANWCSVTHKFVKCLLSEKKWIYTVFSHGLCVDELYKQTIYMKYANQFKLYKKIPNDSHTIMRYIDWNRGAPYVWRSCDFSELIDSDFLFARKFDSNIDADIIEKITQFTESNEIDKIDMNI